MLQASSVGSSRVALPAFALCSGCSSLNPTFASLLSVDEVGLPGRET